MTIHPRRRGTIPASKNIKAISIFLVVSYRVIQQDCLRRQLFFRFKDLIFGQDGTPKALTSIKMEGQEASKQFKEGGDTHEPKSSTITTTTTPW